MKNCTELLISNISCQWKSAKYVVRNPPKKDWIGIIVMHTSYLYIIKAIEGGSQLITAVGNTLDRYILQYIMVAAELVQMVSI